MNTKNTKIELKKLWKSLGDFNEEPSVIEQKNNEFIPGAADELTEAEVSGVNRRQFLGLMAASSAMITTACTNYRDEGKLIPYNKKPEEVLPGKPTYYASSISKYGQSQAILVTTREGRPISILGNNIHPVSIGAAPSYIQAEVAKLYDPDRIKKVTKAGKEVSLKEAEDEIISAINQVEKIGDQEVAIVTAPVTSPASKAVIKKLKAKYPKVRHYSYNANSDSNIFEANRISYGKAFKPNYDLSTAEVVVTVESDILGLESTPSIQRSWAASRDVLSPKWTSNRRKGTPDPSISKLVSIEGDFSTTGMTADLRITNKSDQHHKLLLGILSELASKKGASGAIKAKANGFKLSSIVSELKLDKAKVNDLIQSISSKKKVIFIGGNALSTESLVVINAINSLFDNKDLYGAHALNEVSESSKNEIGGLVKKMTQGKVGVLIHVNVNPVHQLEGIYKYGAALTKVPLSVSIAVSPSQTTKASSIVIPNAHSLESWSVHTDRQGLLNLQQPVISPLYKEAIDWNVLFNKWADGAVSYKDGEFQKIVKAEFLKAAKALIVTENSLEDLWNNALHDGFLISRKSAKLEVPAFNDSAISGLSNMEVKASGGITVYVKPSHSIVDGDYVNNGFLQELAHPVSKVVWDNYAAISLATAKKYGVTQYLPMGESDFDKISVEVNGKKIEIVALVQPGLADDQIVLELGYGQKDAGTLAEGVGVSAEKLLSEGNRNRIISNAKIANTNETHLLVSIQEHHALNVEDMPMMPQVGELVKDAHLTREIIHENTVEGFLKEPKWLEKKMKVKRDMVRSMDRPHQYNNVKWAMAIDLNKCTGCGDCITACNFENNVPVVGKDQVNRGREMHWLRIDRYYAGSPQNPVASVQPMLCMQCDNAPCENVCPVVATTHSPEGINEMTYNRCVGTRYCANNCPYKVRRFNFYNFRDRLADAHQEKASLTLLHNPEVTVRSRGVMEKCNFCVQRVNEARVESKLKDQPWMGQGVITACQSACATGAIQFGNVNDRRQPVARMKKHTLAYSVLEETAVMPNVHYIAKIRNSKEKLH